MAVGLADETIAATLDNHLLLWQRNGWSELERQL